MKIQKKKRLFLLLGLLLFMTSAGCSGEPILADEPDTVEDVYILQQSAKQLANLFGPLEEAFVPIEGEEAFFHELNSRLQWLLEYHEWLFDISAQELSEATQELSYIHFPDGGEAVRFQVFGTSMDVFLLFSDSVWEEGTVCVGVGMAMENLFREQEWTRVVRTSDPLKAAEYGLDWQEPAGGEKAFYEYKVRGKTVRVQSNEDGTLLLPEQIVYCTVDEKPLINGFVGADFHRQRMVSAGGLQGSAFSAVRQYAAYLGKSEDALRSQLESSFQWWSDGSRSFSQERRMELHMEQGVCIAVVVPTQEIFPHSTRTLTEEELLAYWQVPVTWSVRDDYRYEYYFQDFALSMASNEEGIVPLWETYPITYSSQGPQGGYVIIKANDN